MVALGDGSVFTLGGSWSGGEGNKTGELWNVTTNEWTVKSNLLGATLLTNDSQGIYRSDNHMWLQVSPNGRVFHAGPSARMHWIDVEGDGTIDESVLRGDDTDAMNGNAVTYDVGKILTLGGAPSYENSPSSNRAYVITLDGNEASVERVGNMSYPRSFSTSVVLPTGEVVVVGGMSWAYIFSDEGSVRTAEIWNPNTRQFSMLAEMVVPRNYHGIAILLKDGRVMAAGGGLCGNCTVNHNDTEILTPPYLLNLDKSAATRPVILSAPDTIIPGTNIDVVMDSTNSHSFALVRTSVATHAINNDQRRIPLQVVNVNDDTFTLSIPSNPNVVLPGNYFLFAMNENNVPSVAEIVNRPTTFVIPTTLELEEERLTESSTSQTQSFVKSPTVLNMEAVTNIALFVVVLICSVPLRRKLVSMAAPPDVISSVDEESDEEFV
jgi:galactose oxidase